MAPIKSIHYPDQLFKQTVNHRVKIAQDFIHARSAFQTNCQPQSDDASRFFNGDELLRNLRETTHIYPI